MLREGESDGKEEMIFTSGLHGLHCRVQWCACCSDGGRWTAFGTVFMAHHAGLVMSRIGRIGANVD